MYTLNEHIMNKPLVSLSAGEFIELILSARGTTTEPVKPEIAYGISELSDKIGCCPATIYSLKKAGALEGAIISHIGKRIVFDVEKARTAANEFKLSRNI